MSFARIYLLYIAKVERKGHTQHELNEVITWLTGYNDDELQKTITSEYARLEKAIFDQNVRENDVGLACNTGGACSEGPAAKMVLVAPAAGDVELRRKALIEQVLPRWAARCGAECVKNWNATAGKVVNLTAKAN
jgi:hypothetical protein